MVVTRAQLDHLELPALPDGSGPSGRYNSKIHMDEFTRSNLKTILHLITGELKLRGTKTPHVFLPFRSRIDDAQLENFLKNAFPGGAVAPESLLGPIVKKYDEFTLICALKYLWSRLPNHEIIGWDVYLEFKRKEEEQGYPRTAFLTIMPKCLSSPSHASIVYDFLDLLVSIASNSQYNYLSGRKIAKMSSLWAFNPARERIKSAFYDATIDRDPTFAEGLEKWKESSGALFHLLLSFLRAMLPSNDMDTLKLPKTLQSLLISNSYPPPPNNDSVKSMIQIPCVVIKSTKPSENVYELLSKVRHTIKFDHKDAFISVENFTILKNVFKKNSTADIVATLTEESRRVFSRLTDILETSDFDIYPGWAPFSGKVDDNIPLFSELTIHDVTIQDYYIWTWLSSLGSDQHTAVKRNFGRSLIAEVEVFEHRKWIVVSEQVLLTRDYLKRFKSTPEIPQAERMPSNGSHKDMPLHPPPPPLKSNEELLPSYNFENGGVNRSFESSTAGRSCQSDELDDYKKYLESFNDSDDNDPSNDFAERLNLDMGAKKQVKPKKRKPRPPPPVSPLLKSRELTPTASPGGLILSEPPASRERRHISHPMEIHTPVVNQAPVENSVQHSQILQAPIQSEVYQPQQHYRPPPNEQPQAPYESVENRQPVDNFQPQVEPHGHVHSVLATPALDQEPDMGIAPYNQIESAPSSPDTKERKKKKKKKRSKKEGSLEALQTSYFPPGPPPNFIPDNVNGGFAPFMPVVHEPPKSIELKKKPRKKDRKDISASPSRDPQLMLPPREVNTAATYPGSSLPVAREVVPAIHAPLDSQGPPPPLKDNTPMSRSKTPEHLVPRLSGYSNQVLPVSHTPYRTDPSPQPMNMDPHEQTVPSKQTLSSSPRTQLPPMDAHSSSSSRARLPASGPHTRGPSPQHVPHGHHGLPPRSSAALIAGMPGHRQSPVNVAPPEQSNGHHETGPQYQQPPPSRHQPPPNHQHPQNQVHSQGYPKQGHSQGPDNYTPYQNHPQYSPQAHPTGPMSQQAYQPQHGPTSPPVQPGYQAPPAQSGYRGQPVQQGYQNPQGLGYHSPQAHLGYQSPQALGYGPPIQPGFQGAPQGYPYSMPPHQPMPNQGVPQYHQYGSAPQYQRPPRNTAGDVAMMSMPQSHKHNKNQTANKANLRAAFNQGTFGI